MASQFLTMIALLLISKHQTNAIVHIITCFLDKCNSSHYYLLLGQMQLFTYYLLLGNRKENTLLIEDRFSLVPLGDITKGGKFLYHVFHQYLQLFFSICIVFYYKHLVLSLYCASIWTFGALTVFFMHLPAFPTSYPFCHCDKRCAASKIGLLRFIKGKL